AAAASTTWPAASPSSRATRSSPPSPGRPCAERANIQRMSRKPRLDPSIFHLPVEKMREGYYSDKYFVRTRELLLKDKHRPCVTMQVFGKAHAFLGGIDEAIAILKLCSMEWPELEVRALYDGDEIEPWETVLLIEGPYDAFAHLETLYLAFLARRTKVGTNTRGVVEAARPKQVMFFPARHDHWLVQTGDGYAAHIAGAIGVSTDAQASWWGSEGVGTVPHGLIAAYGGDTVLASRKFAERMDPGGRLIPLVVSGGCTVEKIRQFEEEDVPVDMYGVGSSLFQGRFDFTADVVRVEGKPVAKVGRGYRPNPRLERVE